MRILDSIGVPRSKFRAGTYLMGAWAVGSLILAFFQTDVPPASISWHGAIHLIVAILAFIGGAFGTLAISRSLNHVPALGELKRILLFISVLVVVFWLVEFSLPIVSPHLNGEIGGLTERLFLGSVLLWIGLLSGYLARYVKSFKLISKKPSS